MGYAYEWPKKELYVSYVSHIFFTKWAMLVKKQQNN